MALVDMNSCMCVKSELDLFSVPPTQTSIASGSTVVVHPVSSVRDSAGPIQFSIVGSTSDYLDLSNTFLHLGVKITKEDGSDLADDDASPANLFMHSLFSQVDIELNGTMLSSSTNTYAYRAYLETLLNYGKPAKESQLTAALWYKDTAGSMDDPEVKDAGRNLGLVKRKKFVKRSRVVSLFGRLHSDVFFQEKLLLNGVDMRITLTRSKDAFSIMSNVDEVFKIKIVSAALHVRKVEISDNVLLAHAKALEVANAKYPIDRVECKTFNVAANMLQDIQEKIFQGQLPSRVIVGFVDNDAFMGRQKKNPFNFKHNKLIEISLQVDGKDQPLKPIKLNFETGDVMMGYMSLFNVTRKTFKDEDLDISRDDYSEGYSLYGFDLTPDLGESDHFNLLKRGTVGMQLTFSEALAQTINVIVYAEFQNILEVDRNRNIFYDYTA